MSNHVVKTVQSLYDLGRHEEAFSLAKTFGIPDWKPAGVIEYRDGMTQPDKNGSVQLEKLTSIFGQFPKQFHDLKKYRFICKEILDSWKVDEEVEWKIKLNIEMADTKQKALGEKVVQAVRCIKNELRTAAKRPYYRTVEKIPHIFVIPSSTSLEEFSDHFVKTVEKTL